MVGDLLLNIRIFPETLKWTKATVQMILHSSRTENVAELNLSR